jgi:hypothetical protein
MQGEYRAVPLNPVPMLGNRRVNKILTASAVAVYFWKNSAIRQPLPSQAFQRSFDDKTLTSNLSNS